MNIRNDASVCQNSTGSWGKSKLLSSSHLLLQSSSHFPNQTDSTGRIADTHKIFETFHRILKP